MCGIAGIINLNNKPVNERLITSMMERMKHRGPDDDGIYVNNNIGLGFVRLSILDLSEAGHQPMFDISGRYLIIHNGEIFNFLELRKDLEKKGYIFQSNTDTEVILNSFIEWGEECQNYFNGMWAFCIYDLKEKSFFISRDRYGIKPLYYYNNKDKIIFCSEIKPILGLIKNQYTPNDQVIYNYLVFNRTDYNEETFFNEIKKLSPGYCLRIFNENDFNGVNKCFSNDYKTLSQNIYGRRWYDIRQRVKNATPFSGIDEYRECLFSSINLRLRSDVPLSVFLSGGMDSGSIVAGIENSKFSLNTYSAVYGKNLKGDEKDYILELKNDVKEMNFIKIDANLFNTDLNNFLACHESEPIVDPSTYAGFKVFEKAQEKIKVTLNGQGADEQLGGYLYFWGHYFKSLLKEGKFNKLFNEINYYYTNQGNHDSFKYLIYYLLPNYVKNIYRVNKNEFLINDFKSKFFTSSSITRLIDESGSLQDSFIRHFKYKLQHLLKWEDLNSMYFSVESRLPFLDHRLVEGTLAIDQNMILRKGQTKYILREALKGYLPEKIRNSNKKIGFETPADLWFRTKKMKNYVMNILESDHMKDMAIIDSKKAIDLYALHLIGRKNIGKEIWKWIHLDYWYKKHFNDIDI